MQCKSIKYVITEQRVPLTLQFFICGGSFQCMNYKTECNSKTETKDFATYIFYYYIFAPRAVSSAETKASY